MNVRERVREVLRDKLIGDGENKKKLREQILLELNATESKIKGWTTPSSNSLPKVEDIPVICHILNISYYEFFGETNPIIDQKSKELLNAYNSKEMSDHQTTIKKILNIK